MPGYYYDIPYTFITDSSKPNFLVNEEMLNENYFYCIDNYSIKNDFVQVGNGYISIENANPIMEEKYRGPVITRIYTGDQLQFESFEEQ